MEDKIKVTYYMELEYKQLVKDWANKLDIPHSTMIKIIIDFYKKRGGIAK